MRKAVRAIVLHQDMLLVMYRNKFGKEYYTLPGGAVEPGEELQQALIRELAEETSIVIAEPRLVFLEHAGDPFGDQYIFVCDYESGEPQLSSESQEYQIHQLGKNLYAPGWITFADLANTPFVSKNLKSHILQALKQGWPSSIKEF